MYTYKDVKKQPAQGNKQTVLRSFGSSNFSRLVKLGVKQMSGYSLEDVNEHSHSEDSPVPKTEADKIEKKAQAPQAKSLSPASFACSQLGNNGAVQLERRDDVKLEARNVGTDTIAGIGITCHHVIPAEMLSSFYELCQNLSNLDSRIKSKFEGWKKAAVKTANNTARWRERTVGTREANPNYEHEVASACQWMNGNIFFGPLAETRIDDMHNGTAFDRGGYQSPEGLKQKEKFKMTSTNENMDRLFEIYNSINSALNDSDIRNSERTHTRLHSNASGFVCNILEELTEIAKKPNSLHKNFSSSDREAYNTRDWISVGNGKVPSMIDKNAIFITMFNAYNKLASKRLKQKEQEYVRLFENNINTNKCNNLTTQGRQYTIARSTYLLLLHAWVKTTSS